MAAPKFIQAKKTTLRSSITELETGSIVLERLLDIYGNEIEVADIGSKLYLTFAPGGNDEEIVSLTSFTRNADGSVTLDTNIVRALSATYPYGAGGTAHPHYPGTIVVISDQPQLYQAIIDYIDGIAIAGAPDASQTSKGILEVATAAEITAGTSTGSTGALLAITPDQLLLSIYGTRLPSASGAQFLAGATGIVSPYTGTVAPTGFLICDNSAVANDTYPDLLAVIKGNYGVGTGVAFTANSSTDILTSNSHGLANGARLLLGSTSALPSGLTANTVYFVINQTTNTFQVATSAGGTAVNFTDTGSGTLSFYTTFRVPDGRGRVFIGAGTGTRVATFVSRASNVLTISGLSSTANNEFQTGQLITYAAPSGAMTGLTNGSTYYVIRLSNTTISLASSLANAQNGTAIALSSDGTGVQTFTLALTARTLGEYGGEEFHSMSITEILAHIHTLHGGTGGAGALVGVGVSSASASFNAPFTAGYEDSVGSNVPMNNMQPFFAGNWIIKT